MRQGVMLVLLLVVGCAGRQPSSASTAAVEAAEAAATASTRKGCEPATDSTFGLAMPVYRDCAVDREAKPVGRRLETDFRPTSTNTMCYRAIVEFVVDGNGQTIPSTARIVRTTDSQYARAVIEAIPRWRFAPASKAGKPVAQAVRTDQFIQAMVRVSGQPTPPPPSRPSC